MLCRPRRPRRAGEWTSGAAVTFIVNLAASRSVTLAAREAGMSRKAAYALRGRDPAFAAAWAAALAARTAPRRQGDKVEEVEGARNRTGQGDTGARTRDHQLPNRSALRDRFFASLAELRHGAEAPAWDLLPASEPLSLR
jgi:hypothetical protein